MPCPAHIQIVLRTLLFQVCVQNFLDQFVPSYIERVFRIFIEMFFAIISISIYIFGIYLILVLSNCNAIQSTDCHVRYFNKLSIYLSITCNQEASGSFTLQSCKTTVKKCTKKLCCTCKIAFLLIRPIFVFSPFSLPSPLSITRFYVLFEQTINIIGSFVLSPGYLTIISRARMGSESIGY